MKLYQCNEIRHLAIKKSDQGVQKMTQSIKCLFKANHQDLHKRIGLVLCACNARTGEFLAGKMQCLSSKSDQNNLWAAGPRKKYGLQNEEWTVHDEEPLLTCGLLRHMNMYKYTEKR